MELLVWNVVLTGLVGIMGFMLRTKMEELNRLGILLNKTREEVARDHVTRREVDDRFDKFLTHVDQRFNRIEQKLDDIRDQLPLDEIKLDLQIGSATAAVSAMSVGYVMWTLRGSYLIASLLSQLPTWKMLDPLPVLEFVNRGSTVRPEDDESIGELIDRARKNKAPAPKEST